MPESAHIETAKRWVVDNYPYNSTHLLKTLVWLDRIAPGSDETVRMAALTHDMERAFPGPDQPVAGPGMMCNPAYYMAHSVRSARIVGDWLRQQQVAEDAVKKIEALIVAHEIGGWNEANLVQAADSLSFLDTNIDLFLNMLRTRKRTYEEVEEKFKDAYERIQVRNARELALPMYHEAMARLEAAQAELQTASRPRD